MSLHFSVTFLAGPEALLKAFPIERPAVQAGDRKHPDFVGAERVHYPIRETAEKDSADGSIQKLARFRVPADLLDGMLNVSEEGTGESRLAAS